MFNLGGMELLVIMAVALLVLGPDKLPSVMRKVGKTVGELRKASTDFQRTMNTELDSGPESRLLDDLEVETRAVSETFKPPLAESAASKPSEQESRKRALPRARAHSRSRRKPALNNSGATDASGVTGNDDAAGNGNQV